MVEVLILGSLSGTEPMENMLHTSIAVRVKTPLRFRYGRRLWQRSLFNGCRPYAYESTFHIT